MVCSELLAIQSDIRKYEENIPLRKIGDTNKLDRWKL